MNHGVTLKMTKVIPCLRAQSYLASYPAQVRKPLASPWGKGTFLCPCSGVGASCPNGLARICELVKQAVQPKSGTGGLGMEGGLDVA